VRIDFTNRVVAITGASSGIGAALSLELARQGTRLALVGRNQERLNAVREKARTAGAEAETFVCDVTQRAQNEKAVEEILRRFGRIDILIYSAGIGIPTFYRHFESRPIRAIFETNVLGFLDWLEFVLPTMQEKNWGLIVAISSLAAHLSTKRTAGYTASKAALSNLLEGVRKGLRKYGVRVLTIEPGYIRTPMTADNPNMIFPMNVEKAARKILKAAEWGKSVYRFPKIPAFGVRFWECVPTSLKNFIFKSQKHMGI